MFRRFADMGMRKKTGGTFGRRGYAVNGTTVPVGARRKWGGTVSRVGAL
jgi:hypothetical protein